MTIASETLDNIESADKSDWMVRNFYAAATDCADIVGVAACDGHTGLVDRANSIISRLSAACAVKHGPTALAEFALAQ